MFGKTGGPYLRSTYLRGETQFLMDIAGDPPLAKAIADKMADHLAAVGIEQLRRWDLHRAGIWIYDDMGHNRGPMVHPKQFERVLLPAYRRMIRAYKAAGAGRVFLHSDGDIRPLVEMLVDAGIDGLHPLERRAGMDVVRLREQYPRLILAGGMCNTVTLVRGTRAEIEAEAREIIDLGRDGGVIIGSHSVSPEIPLENYLAYHEFCRTTAISRARRCDRSACRHARSTKASRNGESRAGVLPGLVAVAVVDPDDHRVGRLDRGERLAKRLLHVRPPPGGEYLERQARPLGLPDRFEHPRRIALAGNLADRQRDVPEQLLEIRRAAVPLVNARLVIVQVPALRLDRHRPRRACAWRRRPAGPCRGCASSGRGSRRASPA